MTLEEIRGLLEKATPKPWTLNRHGYEAVYSPHEFVENANGTPICGIWAPEGNHEQAANAALIAAAPELAALLVRTVEALRPFAYPVPHDWYAIVGHDATGHPLNAEGVQRQSARSLLRELGVEA